MSLLFRILRAAHATGSHHKLALDALPLLTGAHADGWRRMFLHHADDFMRGAKAPDDTFKDFKNHVLHPRDDYWGGAPEKVDAWYQTLIAELGAGKWPEAAFAAGVLSHYLVDPMHPFHTGQSEAENNIHRALEWSINRAFDDLRALGLKRSPAPDIAIGAGAAGLKSLVCQGADKANASYELLIAHYDIHAGTIDPPSGLDAVSRGVIGELIVHATTAFARVLDRALAEAAVAPPAVPLALNTVIATLKIPAKRLAKRLADADDRRIVQAMYDELVATGRVDKALPEDDRAVRDQYAAEVLPARTAAQARARAQRILVPTPQPSTEAVAETPAEQMAEPPQREALSQLSQRSAPSQPPIGGSLLERLSPPTATLQPPPLPAMRPARIYLSPSDDLEAAPAIGPKTAERLAVAGLRTIADLLAADPEVVAVKTGHRGITADTVRDWQDQARLVCTIPGLRGSGAQLLVGAGFRSAAAIAAAEADKLCAAVLAFAATSEGNRILREAQPPDIEKIKLWCDSAKDAVAKAA